MIYYQWWPGTLLKMRERAFLSQEQLASISGVSTQTISRIERHETIRAQKRTVLKIARALNVHPNELVEEGEEPEKPSYSPFPESLALLV